MNDISKRLQILNAAEKTMSQKGLQETSISEISKEAGVAESVIYQYFKGKEDLLFSVPGERMKEVINYLNEHLEGIRDPESRLRKMIWFTLKFNDTYREYALLLLLECRSNRNFYQHEAYGLIKKYAGILLAILEEGVRVQAFREDVNMRLVRDIILGASDLEKLECYTCGVIQDTLPDFEDIMNLIMPMIVVSSKNSGQESDKSKRILRAAEHVFAEKGYHQATITEISKAANVAEGTVYEYFDNKEHLLFSIPDYRIKDHIRKLDEIFELKNPLKMLQRLIRDHFFLYMSHRDFLKVFLLDIQLNRRFYSSHVYDAFRSYSSIVESILEEGKKDGSIRPEINNRVFKYLFLGAFSHLALRWLLLEKESKRDILEEITELVFLLCRSVSTDGVEVD